MVAQRTLNPQSSEDVSVGSNPTTPTNISYEKFMRVIIYDNGQILVKRKAYRKRVLEYCKNNEVADKLAYWKYTCLPEFRKELEELKYVFRNDKGQLLFGKSKDINDYKYIKGYKDYEPYK